MVVSPLTRLLVGFQVWHMSESCEHCPSRPLPVVPSYAAELRVVRASFIVVIIPLSLVLGPC